MSARDSLSFIRYRGKYHDSDFLKSRDVYLLCCLPPEEACPIYKVGFSVNVVERCYSGREPISGNFPFPVYIICVIDTCFFKEVESFIHDKWKHSRKHIYGGNGATEWFQFEKNKYIDDVSEDFINIAMDGEDIIGKQRYRLWKPDNTPKMDNVFYGDSFCVLGDWNFWYNYHSPASEWRRAIEFQNFTKFLV